MHWLAHSFFSTLQKEKREIYTYIFCVKSSLELFFVRESMKKNNNGREFFLRATESRRQRAKIIGKT